MVFCRLERSVLQKLLYSYFSTWNRASAKRAEFALFETDDSVTGSVNGKVAAHAGTHARTLVHTDLANNDLAGLNLLATK